MLERFYSECIIVACISVDSRRLFDSGSSGRISGGDASVICFRPSDSVAGLKAG